jgi:fatty acid desaturase
LTRFGLTPFAIVDTDLRPVAALRRVRALSLKRFAAVTLRLLALIPFLVLVALPSALIVFGLSFLAIGQVPLIVLQILATLTVLPIADFYLLRLYRLLEDRAQEAEKAARDQISEPPGEEVVVAAPPSIAS